MLCFKRQGEMKYFILFYQFSGEIQENLKLILIKLPSEI